MCCEQFKRVIQLPTLFLVQDRDDPTKYVAYKDGKEFIWGNHFQPKDKKKYQ